ncbi:hypothetical protein AB7292_09240 [Providencia rettgeri]
MKFILALSFFLISLVSHTTYVYIPALILLLAYVLQSKSLLPITKLNVFSFLAFSLLVFGSALHFKTIASNVSLPSEQSFLNNLIFAFILFFIVMFLGKIFRKQQNIENIKYAIKTVLIVHIAIFFIQFLVVYTSGHYIDLVSPVTGEESRYHNYILSGSMSDLLLYRVTGLYVEPSTYASAMTCMIMAAVAMGINRKLVYLATSTLLLNFSTIGIILFILVMFSIFIKKINIKFLIASLIFAIFIFAINYDFIVKFIDDFMFKVSVTSGSRFALMEYIYLDDGFLRLFGSGFFNLPRDLLEKISMGDYSVAAINDAGLFSFLVLRFGILITIPVIFVIFKMKNIVLKSLVICVLVSKMSFLFPIIYLPIIAAWKNDKKLSNN